MFSITDRDSTFLPRDVELVRSHLHNEWQSSSKDDYDLLDHIELPAVAEKMSISPESRFFCVLDLGGEIRLLKTRNGPSGCVFLVVDIVTQEVMVQCEWSLALYDEITGEDLKACRFQAVASCRGSYVVIVGPAESISTEGKTFPTVRVLDWKRKKKVQVCSYFADMEITLC